jgi:hypothetical protein
MGQPMKFVEGWTKDWGQRNETVGAVFLYGARKRQLRLVAEDVRLPPRSAQNLMSARWGWVVRFKRYGLDVRSFIEIV